MFAWPYASLGRMPMYSKSVAVAVLCNFEVRQSNFFIVYFEWFSTRCSLAPMNYMGCKTSYGAGADISTLPRVTNPHDTSEATCYELGKLGESVKRSKWKISLLCRILCQLRNQEMGDFMTLVYKNEWPKMTNVCCLTHAAHVLFAKIRISTIESTEHILVDPVGKGWFHRMAQQYNSPNETWGPYASGRLCT